MEHDRPIDSPASPSRRFVGLIVLIAISFLGFQFLAPRPIVCGKSAQLSQALSNARQIGLALSDFKEKYGRYPDTTTLTEIKSHPGSPLDFGCETSNDLFKQLVVAGFARSEELFFVRIANTHPPDNQTSPASKMLEAGEVGFAYVIGDSGVIPADRPLVVAPLILGTLKFDPLPFDGKAVVLRSDLHAFTYPISPAGHAIGPGGKNLLSPNQPYWNGTPPHHQMARS